MSPSRRVELDSLEVIDSRDIRERGDTKWAERGNQNLRLNVLRFPIPRPELARPEVASSVPRRADKLGTALNVRAEFVLVDKVQPVVVDFFEAGIAVAPIGVLVFGERVPMGADVTSTALLSCSVQKYDMSMGWYRSECEVLRTG